MTSDLRDEVLRVLRVLRRTSGVTMRAGVSEGDVALLEQRLGCYLPLVHRTLLGETNGLEVAFGYERWLGCGPGAPVDLEVWNDPGTWKWAFEDWQADLDQFLVVGMSATGIMFGCWKSDLQEPELDPPFFGLGPGGPAEPARAALSVAFLGGTREVASDPYDDPLAAAVLTTFGQVPADRLVLHGPLGFPVFSDDEEDLQGAMVLPAVDVMVAKADILREATRLHADDEITGVQRWIDPEGRQRLRYQIHRQN